MDEVSWKIKSEAELKKSTRPDLEKKSLETLREAGWNVHRVSHYDARTRRSHDLLGFADLLCWADRTTVLIQVTSKSNASARRKKILSNEDAYLWLKDATTRHIWLLLWHKIGGKWVMELETICISEFVCRQDAKKRDALTEPFQALSIVPNISLKRRESDTRE